MNKTRSIQPNGINNFKLMNDFKRLSNKKGSYFQKNFRQINHDAEKLQSKLFKKQILNQNFDYEENVEIILFWLKKKCNTYFNYFRWN